MNHLETMHVPYQLVELSRNLGKARNGLPINRLVEVTASRGCRPGDARPDSDRKCHSNDLEQRTGVRCSIVLLTQNQTRIYWFSGLKVWMPPSVFEHTPAGSTRTTASSSAQKARIPVWFTDSGTATIV